MAACALSWNAVLWTLNREDFEHIPGLRLREGLRVVRGASGVSGHPLVPGRRRALRLNPFRVPGPETTLRLPGAGEAHVPESKLTGYLLSLDHPAGRMKAAYFITRGFSPTSPELLRMAILEVARSGRVQSMTETPWGTKYYVEGSARAPDGNRVGLATVWMVADRGAPILVTAYPRREPGR